MKFQTLNWERNKKKVIIGVVSIIAIIIIAIIIRKSFAYDSDYLKNQSIDGLTFERANVEYQNGISTFTVEVYNDTENLYKLKNIEIEFKNKEGERVTLIGYIGEIIEVNEAKKLKASVDQDLSETLELNYVINK